VGNNPFTFFGNNNLVNQEQWARRGENDAQTASLVTRIAALEATVTAMANFIKATSAGRLIQAGTTVATTNGGGGATISFPTAFSSAPVVVASNGDASTKDDLIVGITATLVTTTNFEVIAESSAGARIGSTTLRFNWIAFGAA
jgi:hypothetical protein